MKPPKVPIFIRIGNKPEIQIGVLIGTKLEFAPSYSQAQALREAADDVYGDDGPDHPLSVATWLRERADWIENSDTAAAGKAEAVAAIHAKEDEK